jgi:hypothetical protein
LRITEREGLELGDDTRDALAPLNTLADDHKCMVFGVRHLTEKESRQGVLTAILTPQLLRLFRALVLLSLSKKWL